MGCQLHYSSSGYTAFVPLGEKPHNHIVALRIETLARGHGIGVMFQKNTKTKNLEAVVRHGKKKVVEAFACVAEALCQLHDHITEGEEA